MTTTKELAPDHAERKRAESIWWGGALVWVGIVIGAERLNLLPDVGFRGEWWLWIVLGLGVWALIWNLFRASSDMPNPTTWDWTWTVVFLVLGLGGLVNVAEEIVGALVVIAVGAVILFRALTRRQ
jgi:hypothetical protein